MNNRIAENPNGAAEPVAAKDRLAMLEEAQVMEQRLVVQYEEGLARLRESMLIRRGRIDELRRIVNAERAAAKKE